MDGQSIRNRYDALVSQRDTLDNTFEVIEKFVVPYRGDFFKPLSSMGEIKWRRREISMTLLPQFLVISWHLNSIRA